jgi:hypothetical protein
MQKPALRPGAIAAMPEYFKKMLTAKMMKFIQDGTVSQASGDRCERTTLQLRKHGP